MPLRPRPTPTPEQLAKIDAGDWQRAGGGCVCETCGKLYYDHPYFAEPSEFLTILCDGDLVKL
ncbi:hypothetical protein [Bradyrhizobium sp. SZCCHNPS1003]|uniref:hypothetical protein n=1 Tax=Bradyrhizobium sp. SZCCHNPS1003 TaxID=3057330 RepID=UPI0028E48850|nr:hypothetical protein [Bradyrhizobium sp. SZCCHNPS1003]